MNVQSHILLINLSKATGDTGNVLHEKPGILIYKTEFITKTYTLDDTE